jgi:hypothetical protein
LVCSSWLIEACCIYIFSLPSLVFHPLLLLFFLRAPFKGGGHWYLGRVVGVFQGEDGDFAYDVLYEDGDTEHAAKEVALRPAPELEVTKK